MLDGDTIAERVAKLRGDGGRQSDFGDEHENAASRVADRGRQPEIQLRLPAAGDAAHERDAELRGLREPEQSCERSVLLEGQWSDRGPT